MTNPTRRPTSKPGMDDLTAFGIEVPDAKLASIWERVHAFRWEAWSEPPDADGWTYGPPVSFMRRLCEHWLQRFDWREQERSMNARPHFTTVIDDVDLHFVHERGSGENPAPLLIAHAGPTRSIPIPSWSIVSPILNAMAGEPRTPSA